MDGEWAERKREKRRGEKVGIVVLAMGSKAKTALLVGVGRQNLTDLRPASRAPSTPGLTPRWLYQALGAMGGRADYAGVHGGHGERP